MQRYIANESLSYADVESENKLLAIWKVFLPLLRHSSENISTIYIGTETGLLISYDPNSEYATLGTEIIMNSGNGTGIRRVKIRKKPFFYKVPSGQLRQGDLRSPV